MILAGIDEAGYGPLLGPLVVGCSAFEIDDAETSQPLPCLWKRLRRVVSRKRTRSGKKLHINDSKAVYNPSLGLKELERSVLSVFTAWCGGCEHLDDFVARIAPHATAELGRYRWYRAGNGEKFPIEQDATSVRLFANALDAEMKRAGVRCVHLGARVILEREYNRLVEATRNKSNALFSTTAIHIDHLLGAYGSRGLVIFCDRQGGRCRYGASLRLMFDAWTHEIIREEDGHSEYVLSRGSDVVRIIFREKAEEQSLPVAMASMISKYTRELLMSRFNAFWTSILPGLEPTAGYYSDGLRFLNQINPKRLELGIADAELIRCS